MKVCSICFCVQILFPYDYFVKLYNWDMLRLPCGLINCGNRYFWIQFIATQMACLLCCPHRHRLDFSETSRCEHSLCVIMKLVAKQDVLMWVFLIWSTYAAALPMWCCSALLTLGPLLHTCLKELMLKSVSIFDLEVEAYSMKHACSLKVPHGSVIYELMAVP